MLTDFHNSFTAEAIVNAFSSVKKMKSAANWKTSSEVAYEQCSSPQSAVAVFKGRMPFLPSNQQSQSTEGSISHS